ncbi:MAG: hypothetical protein AAGA45_01385 [Verrucomicrobiota bacterium]
MSSPTAEKIIHSVPMEGLSKAQAENRAVFLEGLVEEYVRGVFAGKHNYKIDKQRISPGNVTTTIRRGGSEILIQQHFGLNTRYDSGQPVNFYTCYVEAIHRNRTLDDTAHFNDSIVWCLGAAFGILGAFIGLYTSHYIVVISEIYYGIVLVFGTIGAFLGRFIGRVIFRTRATQLNAHGALDAFTDEWDYMQETLGIIFEEGEGFSFTQAPGRTGYE